VIFPNIQDWWRGRVEASYPLYAGGRLSALESAARDDADAARGDRLAGKVDLDLEVTHAYWSLVTAREAQRVLGEALQVYGDGQQTRCFCDVRDVVEALPRVLAEPACAGRVFNIGRDEPITIEDLARRVDLACRGRGPQYRRAPLRRGAGRGGTSRFGGRGSAGRQ